jgi:hypothetical protein
MPAPTRSHIVRRFFIAVLSVCACFAFAAPAGAAPDSGSGAASPPGPLVNLNNYCQDHGAVAHTADGRTVYCTRVSRTDAWVWAYTPDLMPIDPNARGYTCTDVCRFPDGSIAPNYLRCGVLCGEPPTSGDIQSGFYDCFRSGATYEECRQRPPR